MVLLKTTIDKRSGSVVEKFRLAGGGTLRVFGGFGLQAKQMYAWAVFALMVMTERVQAAIGSNDQPFPGLTKNYAIRKTRQGKGNKRNLTNTGDMLGSISVRSVSAGQARIDITRSLERKKARANEQRAPWWGWSAKDLRKITEAGQDIFRANIANAGIALRGGSRKPVWMDPLGQQTPRYPASMAGGRMAA